MHHETHRLARVAEVDPRGGQRDDPVRAAGPAHQGRDGHARRGPADLQHAKVYVSLMGTQKEQDCACTACGTRPGFVQAKLAARLKTRFTPVITFILDEGVKKSIEVTRLINEALAQSRPEPEPESADGTADEDAEEE